VTQQRLSLFNPRRASDRTCGTAGHLAPFPVTDSADDGGMGINSPGDDEGTTGELPPVGATTEIENPKGGWARGLEVVQREKGGSAATRRFFCLCVASPFPVALRVTPPPPPHSSEKGSQSARGFQLERLFTSYANATTAMGVGIENYLVGPAVLRVLLVCSRGLIAT
jgi:hypothetical protein